MVQSGTFQSTYYDNWPTNYKLLGSQPASPYLARWRGEMYYLAFYDHVVTAEQAAHNFNCAIPPSLPSLQPRSMHGLMNTLIEIVVPVFDNNLNSNTNLVSGYTVTTRLMTLPHKGQLYSSTMSPLKSLPSTGLVLDSLTLYYQPISGEYNATHP